MMNKRNNSVMENDFNFRVNTYESKFKPLRWMKLFITLLPFRVFVSCCSILLLFMDIIKMESPDNVFSFIINAVSIIVLIYEIRLIKKIKENDGSVYRIIRNYFIILIIPNLLSYLLYSNYAANYMSTQELNYIVEELSPGLIGAIIYSGLNLIYFYKRKDFWINDDSEVEIKE